MTKRIKSLTTGFLLSLTVIIITVKVFRADDADLLKTYGSKLVFSGQDESGHYSLYLSGSDQSLVKLRSVFNNDCITPVFSSDGKGILYAEYDGHDFELMYYDLAGNISRQLTRNNDDDYGPVWSQDGRRIAWSRVPVKSMEQADHAEIIASAWPDFQERQLTSNNRMDAYPVFTQGGDLIVESGLTSGLFGLWLVNWKGNEAPLLYEPEISGNGIPNIHNDLVVFERCSQAYPDQFGIYYGRLKTNKLAPVKLSNWLSACNPSPRFSPDGKIIACHRLKEIAGGKKSSQIVLIPIQEMSNQTERVLGQEIDSLKLPRWNRNGTLLAVEDFNKHQLVIFAPDGRRTDPGFKVHYRGQRFLEIYNFDIW